MSPEKPLNPPLTPEQEEMANSLVSLCDLEEIADTPIEMMGAAGTVRYGLGRCYEYIQDMTPDEIREMVMLKLEQQQKPD